MILTRPIQAALLLLIVILLPASMLMCAFSAKTGGVPIFVTTSRVAFFGALTVELIAGVGAIFGVAV